MVKLSRGDLAFMIYILLSSIIELIEYLCRYDGGTGLFIVIAFFFFSPFLIGYFIMVLWEFFILIMRKSLDSALAIFIYVCYFSSFIIIPEYPKWIHCNIALLVLFFRLSILLLFLLWRTSFNIIKILFCLLIIVIEILNASVDFLLFDAIISICYIIFNISLPNNGRKISTH